MKRSLAFSMLCMTAGVGTQSALAILPPLPSSALSPISILSQTAAAQALIAAGPLVYNALKHKAFNAVMNTGTEQAGKLATSLKKNAEMLLERLNSKADQVMISFSKKSDEAVVGLAERIGDVIEDGAVRAGLIESAKNPWKDYLLKGGIGVAGLTTGIALVLLYQHLRSAKKSDKAAETPKAPKSVQVAVQAA